MSTVLRTLTRHNAPFTVKGGGHSPFSGGSSIEDGVTIDLVYLDSIKVSADRKTVSIGPGNRWINVTEALDPLKLAVVGGRTADVGVSGLILGGGISYFSGQKGWACDNVNGFEVVLASGSVIYASPKQHNDLYWALRGGGSLNFGIVTRFDLASFDQGQIWQHGLTFPGSANASVLSTFQNLTVKGLPLDPAAHSFLGVAPAADGTYAVNVNVLHATVPYPKNSIPPVFQPFEKLPGSIAIETNVGGVSTFLQKYATPYGLRQTWGNVYLKANFPRPVLTSIVSLFEARNSALFEAAPGDTIAPLALIQAIPTNVLQLMEKNGGNPLGLRASDGPLIMVSFPISWTDPRNDNLVVDSTRKLIAQIAKKAKQYGVDSPFVYLNYADSSQQVQKGYGKDNYERLKRIAKKYDPQGKLAKLWVGYFKL